MKKKDKYDYFNNNSMNLFFMFCLYLISVLLLYSLTSILNINKILGVIEIISIIIPVIYMLKVKTSFKNQIKMIIIFLICILGLPFVFSKTFDTTTDGNSYHKSSIAFIKNGWNPLYQSMLSFQKNNQSVIKINKEERINLWAEHYPKATWVIAAVKYQLTGNIESGKYLSVLLTIMLIIISYNLLRKIFDLKWSIIFTVMISLNPIFINQLFSYYVDGIMGICFILQIMLLLMIDPNKIDKKIWISLGVICILFVNIKFTGLLYSGIISAVFYFYYLFKNKDFNIFKSLTICFSIVYLIALLIVGCNSYLKNTIDHHNPLYPLIGKDKVDIITTMQPKDFLGKNSLEKFVYSLFARTENTTYDMPLPELKSPISVQQKEIEYLGAVDVRIGGFGPLFACYLILSIILFITALIILIIKEKDKIKYILLVVIPIIISMILVKESWWARYVPQFYYITVLALGLGVYIFREYKVKYLVSCYVLGTIMIMMVNIYFFGTMQKRNIDSFVNDNKELIKLSKYESVNIINKSNLPGYLYNLDDKNINYFVVDKINDNNKIMIFNDKIEIEVK